MTPGPVVEYIARDQHTLLGRYSVERFSAMLVLLLVSVTVLYLTVSERGRLRHRVIRVVVIAIGVAAAVITGEVISRAMAPDALYVVHDNFRNRPPHYQAQYVFQDKPFVSRSYPKVQPGYPPVSITLKADGRGFRNPESVDQAEVVFIGDSFTEGPEVAREQLWTTRFGDETGLTIYNLGTSGENPGGYVPKLTTFGLSLKPRAVVIMIYEGNDFRGHRTSKDRSIVKRSQLRLRLKQLLVETLGPINTDGTFPRAEIIDWLPLAVPAGANAAYYVFKPRNIGELYRTEQEFHEQRGWKQARGAIEGASEITKQNHIRLLVMYAPSKVHVLLPLVIDSLDPDKVLEFAKLHRSRLPTGKKDVQDGRLFLSEFAQNLDVQENAVKELCEELGIEFVSLTEILRQAISRGQQAYYTYDQHWTPDGHKLVARTLIDYWAQHP